LQNID